MGLEADVELTQMAGLLPGEPGDERLRVQFLRRPMYDKLTTEGAEVPPTQAKEWIKAHPDDSRVKDLTSQLAKPGRHLNAPVVLKAAGRKHFADEEIIRIAVPGKIQQVTEHKVKPHHRARFARQYAAFKTGENQDHASGTPLSVLSEMIPPVLRPSQIEELKFFNVHTVEQLAEMPDANAQHFMGMNAVREKAKAYLTAAQSQAPLADLRLENEKLAATVASQAAALKDLTDRFERAEKDKKSG